MPRRVGKNVFDVARQDAVDQPTVDQQPLSALLPRVTGPREDRDTTKRAIDAGAEPGAVVSANYETRLRGNGGRPAGERRPPAGISSIAARVPTDLYLDAVALVKGPNKPSWGQLVSWTCQDEEGDVLAAVLSIVDDLNAPRRLRGQNREGGATTQVTARMTAEELVTLERVREAAASRAEVTVARTAVVIAALRIATLSGVDHSPAGS